VPLPDILDLLPLALLGGVLGLDVVSFPQAMISRPIVAATIAGAFVGDAAAGLLVGALLELVAIETLPFGASRYPEWGSAAVVAGALVAARPGAASLAFAVTTALLVAWGAGVTMVWLRRLNARLARARQPALESGSGRTVVGLQLLGMSADLVRGFLVTLLALVALVPIGELVVARWSAPEPASRAVVVAAATAVTASAAWKLFHAVPRARALFIGGLVTGSLVLLLR
jgi:mannose/fructose/N-acetylgalactosamine-specific phosphotransferase system component IIC